MFDLLEKNNNTYELKIYNEKKEVIDIILIYAPNYNIALDRAKQHIKSQEI